MSLEAALVENTAAMRDLIDQLKTTNAGRDAAVAAITSAADGAPAGRPRKTAAERAAEKAAAELAAAAPPASPPATQPLPSVEDLRASAVAFTTVDEATKPARKEFLKAVTEHLGLDKLVNADEGDRARIIGWFAAKAAGQDVSFSDGEDEDAAAEDPDDIG